MFRNSATYVVYVTMASLILLTGCDSKLSKEDVAIEEDIVMNDGSGANDWIVDEIVPVPAALPDTVAGERPSTNDIWVPGEWKRGRDEWVWQSGRWMKPPHKHASWMKGHWRMESGKWHWSPAHWVLTSQNFQSREIIAPPEPRPEVIPPKPSDRNHWVAGYWDWDGHWSWVGGYWTNKPHPDAEWVAGHWDEFGSADGYRWIGGHWHLKSEQVADAG